MYRIVIVTEKVVLIINISHWHLLTFDIFIFVHLPKK